MSEEENELLVDRDGPRVTLTLNRPQRRNALSRSLVRALTAALAEADADPDVRVVVVTAAGEQAFCAGGDLAGDLGDGGVAETTQTFAALMTTMDSLGTPLVARLQGHCVGGGLGLTLACDFAVAADDVKIGTPEVRSGVFPMMIGPLVERHLGPKRAAEMFFTGLRIPAAQALEWGMLSRCVPRAELDATVDGLIEAILAVSPSAIRLGRQALAATRHLSTKDAAPVLGDKLVEVLTTEDAMEGISAFLQKRKPEWKNR